MVEGSINLQDTQKPLRQETDINISKIKPLISARDIFWGYFRMTQHIPLKDLYSNLKSADRDNNHVVNTIKI